MKGLEGRKFVVVGGANGIGEATTKALIEENAKVVIVDNDFEKSRRLEEKYPNQIDFKNTDITNEDDIVDLFKYMKEEHHLIHGIANIATANVFKTMSTEFNDWFLMVKGSVAPYSMITTFLTDLMTDGGAVVNMSSISAVIAQPNFGTYSSSKAAISALTRCQALDFAEKSIRVNAVCPGTIWTENNAFHIMKDTGLQNKEEADSSPEIGGKHILKRCGEPSEVADAITFLLSENSSFITGTELYVDGGYTAL